MIDPLAARIIGVMTAWLLTLSALRFMGFGGRVLGPIIVGTWKLFTCGRERHEHYRTQLLRKTDLLGDIFLDLFVSPVTIMLIFGGVILIGLGVALDGFGDIALAAARHPEWWIDLEQSTTWLSALLICVGMAALLAAFSRNRTLSVAVSCLWMLTGLGVGAIVVIAKVQ